MKNRSTSLFALAGFLALGTLFIAGKIFSTALGPADFSGIDQLALPYDANLDVPADSGTPLSKPTVNEIPPPSDTVTVPVAPSNLAYEMSQISGVQLTWNDNSDNETGFIVEQLSASGDTWVTMQQYDTPNNDPIASGYSPPLFDVGVTYTLRVRAVNAAGQSDPSNSITFTMAAPVDTYTPDNTPVPDTQPPNVFIIYPGEGNSVIEGQTAIESSATDENGVAGVQLYLSGPGQNGVFLPFRNEDTTNPYVVVGDFTPGAYTIYAVARDTSNNQTTSGQVSFNVVTEYLSPTYVPPTYVPPATYVPPPTYTPPPTYQFPIPFNYTTYETSESVVRPATAKKTAKLSRNLRLKDEGEDVRLLQKMLNTLGYTVANEGAGSPGHEGMAFDTKTELALKSYQSAQSTTGLMPNGIMDNATTFLIDHDYKAFLADSDSRPSQMSTSTDTISDDDTATSTEDLSGVQGVFGRIRRGFDGFILHIKQTVLSYIL